MIKKKIHESDLEKRENVRNWIISVSIMGDGRFIKEETIDIQYIRYLERATCISG